MQVQSALRINMTGLCAEPERESERYRAAVDMAAYADAKGFSVVNLEEHHCASNGWLPSPITLASAIAARTERARITITALLVTLYDPVRLAEDLAIIDLLSQGRLSFVAGLGYRPEEYHAMGKSWEQRGELMDEALETMLAAWTGEPFEYRGKRVQVTPVPMTRPHPLFFVGGMSKAAARRAARFGLPFYPPMRMPELEAFYREELERNGTQGFSFSPGGGNSMLFVADDPEAAWQELSPYFLRETQEYASWKQEGTPRPSEQDIQTLDELRSQKRYEILSPEECKERAQSQGAGFMGVMHPLAGGIPLERSWQLLTDYVEKVVEPLAQEG